MPQRRAAVKATANLKDADKPMTKKEEELVLFGEPESKKKKEAEEKTKNKAEEKAKKELEENATMKLKKWTEKRLRKRSNLNPKDEGGRN